MSFILAGSYLKYSFQTNQSFRPRMADITKEQLKKEIQEILKDADLDNTSAKKVLEKCYD